MKNDQNKLNRLAKKFNIEKSVPKSPINTALVSSGTGEEEILASDDDDDVEAQINDSSVKIGLFNVLEDDLKQKAINHECMICLA